MSPKEAPRVRRSGRGRVADWFTPARTLVVALVVLAIVFMVENTEQVRIRLIIPLVTMPLYLALLLMFLVGALCGGLFFRRRSG
ncbi:lipopolysaccharide assembly protein LapA domain-containing protein [Streptomyces sp. NPDC047315]|uniref:lipopolysaccharide assembly protein LapA domain-containing protein n=1 Tax=Streptomyces sp. NPDC047315 TaxID=3155142 RepID=UPI0033C7FE6F